MTDSPPPPRYREATGRGGNHSRFPKGRQQTEIGRLVLAARRLDPAVRGTDHRLHLRRVGRQIFRIQGTKCSPRSEVGDWREAKACGYEEAQGGVTSPELLHATLLYGLTVVTGGSPRTFDLVC